MDTGVFSEFLIDLIGENYKNNIINVMVEQASILEHTLYAL